MIILVIMILIMDCADNPYPDCVGVTCPDGEWLRHDMYMFYLFYYCCIYI